MAAQDQSLKTKNYQSKVMKTTDDPNCRICGKYQETIDHLVSGCPLLALKEYLIRHNKVAKYIHWKLCKNYGIQVPEKWYDYEPAPVVENDQITILWDFSIRTDRTILANRPDIVVKNKSDKTTMLLDVAIPSDKNVATKIFEKISKYKDLEIELTKSWNSKTKTIPIIIGSLGIINKSALKYISSLPGDINVEEIQKITLLGTAHILRKALAINTITA